jgi:curved DNA-binding protein CbpA
LLLLDPAPNFYNILGVKSTASLDEIRRRYKFLVVAFHPDRFLRTPEHHALAEQRIKEVNEAYRVLSDPQTRTQYDLARLATYAPSTSSAHPFVSQMQYDVAQAQARSAQLEQELLAWRSRYEVALADKSALQQEQSEREQSYQQERQSLQTEIDRLSRQLEEMVRGQVALEARLKEQQTKANKKAAKLAQELATQERLVENLAATKADWERSNQSRYELLAQQVQKLQEEVKRRDASLVQLRQVQRGLEERLANAEHEARLAAQSAGNALRAKQQEVDTLLADREHAGATQVHEQKSVRLWQIVAVIAIVNTLILLGLFLLR